MPDYVILNEAQRSEESKAQHRRFLAPLGMTIEAPPSSPRHSRAHHRHSCEGRNPEGMREPCTAPSHGVMHQ